MERKTLGDFYQDYFMWAYHLNDYADYLESRIEKLARVVELSGNIVEAEIEPCVWNYYGYCQKHGGMGPLEPGRCNVKELREALKALEE